MVVAELIEKEDIQQYKFVQAPEDCAGALRHKLAYAQRLGNEFKAKTEITFNTTEGAKKVVTTVWAVTEGYVQLKNGVMIPVKSLIDIAY